GRGEPDGQGKRCAPIEEDDGWLQGGKRRRKGGLLLRGPCGFGELDLDESAAIWCAAVPTAPIVEGAEGEAALAAEGGDGSTAVDLGLMESCECLGVHGASVWGGGRSSNLAGGSCRDGVHRGFTVELKAASQHGSSCLWPMRSMHFFPRPMAIAE